MILLLSTFAGAAEPTIRPDQRWSTLETEHFRLHHPVSRRSDDPRRIETERTALALARAAEDLWLRLGDRLGFFVEETVDIVVLDQGDGLNAFTVPQLDWIVVSAHPGPDLWRMRGRHDWPSEVLAHELGHLFAHKAAASLAERASLGLEVGGAVDAGFPSGPQGTAGARVVLRPHEATWWSEGGAELLAEQAGVGWWTTSRDATLRVAALEDRLLGWDQLQVAGDGEGFQEGERAYQQGYAFLRWLEERAGEGTFRRMAREAARRYPARWDGVLRRVTGADPEELFAAHLVDLRARYQAQREAIEAAGRVEGVTLTGRVPPWEPPPEPAGRANWELTTRVSPDGRWLAQSKGSWIQVVGAREDRWRLDQAPTSPEEAAELRAGGPLRLAWVPASPGHGFAFVPGQDAMVIVADEDAHRPSPLRPDDGTRFAQLFLVDLHPDSRVVDRADPSGERTSVERTSIEVETSEIGGSARAIRARVRPIPGTLRGADPAVSASGRLAFVQVRDGTANLVTCALDGSDRRELTHFDDGTWIQGPSWSPEGDRLVVSMHRHHQSNLWTVDATTGELRALTWDAPEERDPSWEPGGTILFAADPDGVFDVFRLDPASGEIHRVTRVLGGAAAPSTTPSGTLLYGSHTADGWRAVGLPAAAQLAEPASGFRVLPGREAVERDLAPGPSAPAGTGSGWVARPYRPWRALLVPAGGPVIRLDVSPAGAAASVGGSLRLADARETQVISAAGLVGEDLLAQGSWAWRGPGPTLEAWGAHEDARHVWVGTRDGRVDRRRAGHLGLTFTWPVNAALRLLGESQLASAAIGGPKVPSPVPRLRSWRTSLGVEAGPEDGLAPIDAAGAVVRLTVTGARSEVLDPDGARRPEVVPYAQLRLHALSLAPPSPALRHHRVEVGWALVATSRDLPRLEEVRAGGDHPYALRLGALEPSLAFAGFAPWSLAGENAAIFTLGWSLPLARELGRRVGPWTFDEVRLRLAADAGNLWSFRGARPEVPFVDAPRDHGLPVLADGVVELRVAAWLFDAPFDSFLRVAHAPWVPARSADAVDGAVPELLGGPAGGTRVLVGVGTGW